MSAYNTVSFIMILGVLLVLIFYQEKKVTMTLRKFCLKCCKIKGVKTRKLGVPYFIIGQINVIICLLGSVFSGLLTDNGFYSHYHTLKQ